MQLTLIMAICLCLNLNAADKKPAKTLNKILYALNPLVPDTSHMTSIQRQQALTKIQNLAIKAFANKVIYVKAKVKNVNYQKSYNRATIYLTDFDFTDIPYLKDANRTLDIKFGQVIFINMTEAESANIKIGDAFHYGAKVEANKGFSNTFMMLRLNNNFKTFLISGSALKYKVKIGNQIFKSK